MSDHSAIEWTDATWSPTVGCMKVSAGCEHCYAINTAYRQEFGFKRADYQGLTRKLPDGSLNWTGTVRTLENRLMLPLSWTKPRRIFVDSMSDLFHEDVPDEFIAYVFGVMALAQHHTFQVLTKRPERMLRWMTEPRILETTADYVGWAAEQVPGYQRIIWDLRGSDPDNYIGAMAPSFESDAERKAHYAMRRRWPGWPLPNVWLGVSTEDQRAADERIPLLLETPAAVRFLSVEPMIGPLWLHHRWTGGIDWVIAGGESGHHARPIETWWATSLRDQCRRAAIPFFFKQWGGRTHAERGRELEGQTYSECPQSRGAVLA